MKTGKPYEFIRSLDAKYIAEEIRKQRQSHKPRLTLIANEPEEKDAVTMSTEKTPAAAPIRAPLHQHNAFEELRQNLEFLQLASAALEGVGALLDPGTCAGDEQLNGARRSEAAAVFRFFGAALKGPANIAYDAKERLENAVDLEPV